MSENQCVRRWLGAHIDETMDSARGLSSRLMRAKSDGVLKVGVDSEATVDEHIHALVDLLAWHHYEVSHETKVENRVQLALGRGAYTEESLPPLRTLRTAHTGSPMIELYVEDEDGSLNIDGGIAPKFDGPTSARYATYLEEWYTKPLIGLSDLLFKETSDTGRLRLYPQLSASPKTGSWSIRLDGLQVGEVNQTSGVLRVGKQEGSSHKSVKAWRELNREESTFSFTADTVLEAADLIRKLIASLGGVPGELLDHGVPEHALESTIVRGDRPVTIGGQVLLPLGNDKSAMAYGSQIPTLWAPNGGTRYLDALLHDGRVPWAVEMKVKSGGGYGAYLRHAIGQAVLYRHFLRSAGAYEPWFQGQGLDQHAVRAAVLYPQPTATVQRKIAGRIGNLWLTAAAFDVQVATVDAGWLH